MRVTPALGWRNRRLAPEVWLLTERDLADTLRIKACPSPWAIDSSPENRAVGGLGGHPQAVELTQPAEQWVPTLEGLVH